MSAKTVLNVQRQVAKAKRRLLVQTLFNSLAKCWTAALVLSAVWFLAQPWLFGAPPEWLRWAVSGGIFAVATAGAIWLTRQRAPSAIEAALEIDLRFKLKERTTSSLTLAPEIAQSPAGRALAADADAKVAKIDVRQGFPLHMPKTAALVPVFAAVLALIALFYNPTFRPSEADAAKDSQKVANANDIAEKFNKLKKPTDTAWPKEESNDKLEEIAKLREKLLQQPFDPMNKDKLRERLQQMVPLEEKIKDRLEDLKTQQERNKALQNKLKEMGSDPKRQLDKDGPAKGLEDALNSGDLNKAKKEIESLADKLKNNKLSEEERKMLQQQLDEMQNKLQEMADLKGLKDQLKKDLDAGNISQEDFDKMMAKALENADQFQELEDFSKILGECKGFLDDGDPESASERLRRLARLIEDLDPDAEYERLRAECEGLEALMAAMRNGLGAGEFPGGQRPVAEEGDLRAKTERQKGTLDNKTQFRVSGSQKGGTFNKVPANQVGGVFRQAQQDAPEAIERQQVPADAAEILRGYYENLGGTKKK